MAEIGDEELSGILPKVLKPLSQEFQDIGYYKDEKGYIHFGVMPKKDYNTPVKGNIDTGYYDGYNITSDSRYR